MVLAIESELLDTAFNFITRGGDYEGDLYYFLLDKCGSYTLNADSLASLKAALIEKIKAEMPEIAITLADIKAAEKSPNILIEKIKTGLQETAIRKLYIEAVERSLDKLIAEEKAQIKACAEYEAARKTTHKLTGGSANIRTTLNITAKCKELEDRLKSFSKRKSTQDKINANKEGLVRILDGYLHLKQWSPMDWVMPMNLKEWKYTLDKEKRGSIQALKVATQTLTNLLPAVNPLREVFSSGMEYKQGKNLGELQGTFNQLVSRLKKDLVEFSDYIDSTNLVSIKNTDGIKLNIDQDLVLVSAEVATWCEASGISVKAAGNSTYPKILRVFLDVAGKDDMDRTSLAAAALKMREHFKKK